MTAVRGELWTAAGGGRIASKPRPVLILQSDLFAATDYVTVALLTTTHVDSPTRVPVRATDRTGIAHDSYVMVDKITTIPRARLGQRCGAVDTQTMLDVERAVLVFLGIAA